MIYLDHGATSFYKPHSVHQAVQRALLTCGNPGRGGYGASMAAARMVLQCRQRVAELFDCQPEQVVITSSCTHGLNMAIQTLVKPGSRVVISGFEHNAVTRPLYALGAKVIVAGRKLFDWQDTLEQFEKALRAGADAAVFTCMSNVFGYILPVEQMAELCHRYRVPFILDGAQGAGKMMLKWSRMKPAFMAMPGHKGLLGPQGTGVLICGILPRPLIYGGTGSVSRQQQMPDFLPDGAEAGTLNVPGIAGLSAGIAWVLKRGEQSILDRETQLAGQLITGLKKQGIAVFAGEHQGGTVSFTTDEDCEVLAQVLAQGGFCVRAGLHCAPLAHESAGTLRQGTVRVSVGYGTESGHIRSLVSAMPKAIKNCKKF